MLQSYFSPSSKERKASILLLTVIVLLLFFGFTYPIFYPQPIKDNAAFQLQVQQFEAEIIAAQLAAEASKPNYGQKKYYPKKYPSNNKFKQLDTESFELTEPFDFDPNTASLDEFKALGLTKKTAQSILNYREKGGSFRQKSDFKKIYGLAEEDYERLLPFLLLPDSLQKTKWAEKETKYPSTIPSPKELVQIEINKATAEDFQQLKGIGPSFAKRIINYRTALGGFVRVEQVAEVYGLPDSVFQIISVQLLCQPTNIHKLNINTATLEELKAHPYLRFKHAKAILRWREEKGSFKDVDILQSFMEFDDAEATFWRIKPYLSLR